MFPYILLAIMATLSFVAIQVHRRDRDRAKAELGEFQVYRLGNAPKSPDPNTADLQVVGRPFAESHSYLWVKTTLPDGEVGYICLTTSAWNVARTRAMKQDEDLLYFGVLPFEEEMVIYEEGSSPASA